METTTTGRRATPAMRCPRLPNAHPPDRQGAPRSPGRTRQHGVCCRWGPRQGPRQHLATYALSARTYYGLRGPAVSRQRSKGVSASHRRTPTAIFMVPSTLCTWKPSADRRPSYTADFHAETSGLRTMSAARGHIAPGACDLAGSLAVGCRTANGHRHVHATPPSASGV